MYTIQIEYSLEEQQKIKGYPVTSEYIQGVFKTTAEMWEGVFRGVAQSGPTTTLYFSFLNLWDSQDFTQKLASMFGIKEPFFRVTPIIPRGN